MQNQLFMDHVVPAVQPQGSPSQTEFDKHYITASEIARDLRISRVAIHHARQRGVLPDPIAVGNGLVFIWKRDAVAPFIKAWQFRMDEKKGITA